MNTPSMTATPENSEKKQSFLAVVSITVEEVLVVGKTQEAIDYFYAMLTSRSTL